ncbi:ORF63 [callitrichine gammaherpesvirus 3]|uniref:ORF63 n=1 Tax=callitrichine gammaherpesvirus 3 TaxID=106331 RepID=Q8BEN3_9GAMA|nr:ORF63 [callitrichine gammaherpesvirus 3]AAN64284.1 ORF63 [callitrichine gammaherpesvirus 3]
MPKFAPYTQLTRKNGGRYSQYARPDSTRGVNKIVKKDPWKFRAPGIRARTIVSTVSRHRRNEHNGSSKSQDRLGTQLTLDRFFTGISTNFELGKDFLREINRPICVSKSISVPLRLASVPPGRCLKLSSFGHSLVMGSHCDVCAGRAILDIPQELGSIQLSFFNNVHQVLAHKQFYVSLLSNSPDAVKAGIRQPTLLYAFILAGHFDLKACPVFTFNPRGKLTMFLMVPGTSLHLSETCLKLLSGNICPTYNITLDLIGETFCLHFEPLEGVQEKTISVDESAIYEAIKGLDWSDELRLQIINYTQLISERSQ